MVVTPLICPAPTWGEGMVHRLPNSGKGRYIGGRPSACLTSRTDSKEMSDRSSCQCRTALLEMEAVGACVGVLVLLCLPQSQNRCSVQTHVHRKAVGVGGDAINSS